MRVLCRHGHFAFYPSKTSDIARFSNYFDEELVRDGDFYTFPLLKQAPRYSIAGKPYLTLPALKTYEGRAPWDVLRENGFVYHILSGLLVPKASITILINPPLAGFYFLAQSPLIQPGSRNTLGQQILSYDGEFFQDTVQLKVREFSYE